MKANVYPKNYQFVLRIIYILLFPASLFAQPDYVFKNPILEYGTDLQIGAKYRFKDVKPGIDGILEIKDMTGGMTLNQLDGGSGFDEAFQPYINCAPKKKGYIEFQLDMVAAGTYTSVFVPELPLTAIDIDGWEFPDDKLYETDEFEMTSDFYTLYDLTGSNLDVKTSSGWVTAVNKSAITYDGIDTVQKDVMFSAVHQDVTKVLFRVGADNKSKEAMTRLRSVYFQKFAYAAGILPINGLLSFNGLIKNNNSILNWKLKADCGFRTIAVEKSNSGKGFLPVTELNVSPAGQVQEFSFTDPVKIEGNVFYRLKTTDQQGKPAYSQVVVLKNNSKAISGIKIYPNVVESGASIQLNAGHKEQVSMLITDFSGRTMKQQQFQVLQGTNSLTISGMEQWAAGQYVVVLQVGGEKYAQQILKR